MKKGLKVSLMVLMVFSFVAGSSSAEEFADVDRSALIERALAVQSKSYAPYSHFNVAAAALFDSGKIYTGVNVENSSFPAGTCAERTAIVHAVASGEKRLVAIAIVGGANGVNRDYCAPCGVCRQVMREFGNPREVLVVMAKSPDDYVEKTLEELLPMSFGPENLK